MYQIKMQEIIKRHEAQSDTASCELVVSWCDMQLLEIIRELANDLEELQSKFNEHVDQEGD